MGPLPPTIIQLMSHFAPSFFASGLASCSGVVDRRDLGTG